MSSLDQGFPQGFFGDRFRSPFAGMVTVFSRASKARARRALLVLLMALGTAMPVHAAEDESLRGPDVTIIAEEDRTIYEYRQNGELRAIRVVPTFGRPYYLVPRDPSEGFGDLERADMLLPSWTILEF